MAWLNLHGYQERAKNDLVYDPFHALLMDPGLGKTAITLSAFLELREQLDVVSMLVVAPLRVCLTVWPDEVQEWDQFRGLKTHYLGDEMENPPKADIYLINHERIGQLFGKAGVAVSKTGRKRRVWNPGPWRDWKRRPDMLVMDESSRFKRSTGVRTKTMRRYLDDFGRRVALTGTPAPNGAMDLHGQMLLVDRGKSLDHRITYFRDEYFNQVDVGRGKHRRPNYELKDGSFDRICGSIAPRVTVLRAADYLDLPPMVVQDVKVPLPAQIRRALDSLEEESAAELEELGLDLIEQGGALTKTRQLINGMVYNGSPFENEAKTWTIAHTAKLDALEDLVHEIGRPVMVTYEFRSEREEILKRLSKTLRVGVLGGRAARSKSAETIRTWNAGQLDVLLVHPSAAGHGLNLQTGGDSIVWFAPIWDLELYIQLNGRLCRQGQRADRVFVYHLVGTGTADIRVAASLRKKNMNQEKLFEALKGQA